jgi:AcrR family transcriptional regulator
MTSPPPATAATPSKGRRRGAGKGDRREAAILDAAESLLGDPGYEETTIERITAGAGITRPSFYFYFGSKQEAMTAVVERTLAPFAALGSTLGAEKNATAALTEAVELAARQWREHPAVMRFAAQNTHTIPGVGRHWQATIRVSREAVAEVLVRGGVSKSAKPSPGDLAAALVAMAERSFWNLHSRRHTRAEETALVATLDKISVAAMEGPRP